MKNLLAACAVLILCGMTMGNKNSKACLPPYGKYPFDEVKFSGKWYVIGRLATTSHALGATVTCSKVDYSVHEDDVSNVTRINMKMSLKVDGEDMRLVSTGQPMYKHMKSVAQTMWKKDTDKEWKGVMLQSILATDYTTFALYYVCKPFYKASLDTFDKFQVLHVWSRTPTMQDALYDALQTVLRGYDLDVDDMVREDHDKC